ncbi:MAG: hypothetical protein RH982_18090 [Parvibaculum sp.]|uniref:DUF7662 domain-containing protein n=1 Tax=Parvibaculum sp. TaxID=2024848 RepID=UPI0032EC173D
MSKYDPLRHHLNRLKFKRWRASFDDIEHVLGFRLPASAYKYPAWWANESSSSRPVQKNAWQSVSWQTEELDLTGRQVTFVRK